MQQKKVVITSASKQKYHIAYDGKTTVGALKKKIRESGGPDVDSQDLFLDEQVLSDEKLLKYYDLPDQASLFLTSKSDEESSPSMVDKEDLERKADLFLVSDPVYLNVGGKQFASSLHTLSSQSDSVLGLLFSKTDTLPRDKEGKITVTLDCDGDVFGTILTWLRRGELPKDLTQREEQLLRLEAKFLGLSKLEKALDDLGPGGRTIVTFRDIIALGATLAPGEALSLAGVDMHGQWLAGIKLHKADLRSAILRRADLRFSNCSKANFQDADLTRATFAGASLSLANFSSAMLHYTNFSDANLQGACLRGAKIKGADFSRAKLRDAQLHNDLKELKFAEVDFSRVNLSGVNLSYANLTGADLRLANLERANLSHAILIGTLLPMELKEVNLSDVNLTGFNFDNFRLIECNLSGANLTDANLTTASMVNVNFTGTILTNASLPPSLKVSKS